MYDTPYSPAAAVAHDEAETNFALYRLEQAKSIAYDKLQKHAEIAEAMIEVVQGKVFYEMNLVALMKNPAELGKKIAEAVNDYILDSAMGEV